MRKGQHHTERSRALTSAKRKLHGQTPPQMAALLRARAKRAALQRYLYYGPLVLPVPEDDWLAPRWARWTDKGYERRPEMCLENTWILCQNQGIAFVWSTTARKFAFHVRGLELDEDRSSEQGIALILVRAREHGMKLDREWLMCHLLLLSMNRPTLEQVAKMIDDDSVSAKKKAGGDSSLI